MQRHVARSAIVRYGIAVLCVTVAVILALWLRPVTLVGGQLSLIAILITGWVCGLRPALVAWVLATLAFAYYFAPPLYAFRVDPPERPGFIIFTLLGLFMATVSAARRKAQGLLESARALLETRVRERTADLERSNERLRESEEQWRAVFENNPTMYFMVDAAGTVVSVNPFGAEQLGYSVDELVGQSMLKVFCGPDRQAVQAHVALCLQQLGRPFRWELRKVRKDGTVLWVRETAKAMRRAGGEPIVLVASEDITEHKEAEEERQERRWMIESMDRVNRAIQGTSDLEQMMSDVLEATLSIFECDRAWLVYPCDPEASSVRHTMHRARPEFPGRFGVGEDFPLHPDSVTVHRIVRAASGPVRFDPESEHALSPEEGKLFGIQSRIVMALSAVYFLWACWRVFVRFGLRGQPLNWALWSVAAVSVLWSVENITPDLLLGALLGLFGGLGLALLLEHLDNTMHMPEESERSFGVPCLALVPDVFTLPRGLAHPQSSLVRRLVQGEAKLCMPSKNFAANDRRLSLISEVYHKLRMAILMSRADESPKTLLFTSSTPGEGKTTTATNTAIMFALMGSRVLVVDADLRQPSCLKALRVESDRGLADYLANLSPLDQVIQPTSIPNLSVLGAGSLPPSPTELLGSKKMSETLAYLKQRYDYVFIDSPPVIPVSDAVVLSTIVDGLIFVVRGQMTPKPIVREALAQLGNRQSKILGLVLNRVNMKSGEYRNYYHYYNSGDYFPTARLV